MFISKRKAQLQKKRSLDNYSSLIKGASIKSKIKTRLNEISSKLNQMQTILSKTQNNLNKTQTRLNKTQVRLNNQGKQD